RAVIEKRETAESRGLTMDLADRVRAEIVSARMTGTTQNLLAERCFGRSDRSRLQHGDSITSEERWVNVRDAAQIITFRGPNGTFRFASNSPSANLFLNPEITGAGLTESASVILLGLGMVAVLGVKASRRASAAACRRCYEGIKPEGWPPQY